MDSSELARIALDPKTDQRRVAKALDVIKGKTELGGGLVTDMPMTRSGGGYKSEIQAREQLGGLSRTAIWAARAKGLLKFHHIGRRVVYSEEDLRAFVEKDGGSHE